MPLRAIGCARGALVAAFDCYTTIIHATSPD